MNAARKQAQETRSRDSLRRARRRYLRRKRLVLEQHVHSSMRLEATLALCTVREPRGAAAAYLWRLRPIAVEHCACGATRCVAGDPVQEAWGWVESADND